MRVFIAWSKKLLIWDAEMILNKTRFEKHIAWRRTWILSTLKHDNKDKVLRDTKFSFFISEKKILPWPELYIVKTAMKELWECIHEKQLLKICIKFLDLQAVAGCYLHNAVHSVNHNCVDSIYAFQADLMGKIGKVQKFCFLLWRSGSPSLCYEVSQHVLFFCRVFTVGRRHKTINFTHTHAEITWKK